MLALALITAAVPVEDMSILSANVQLHSLNLYHGQGLWQCHITVSMHLYAESRTVCAAAQLSPYFILLSVCRTAQTNPIWIFFKVGSGTAKCKECNKLYWLGCKQPQFQT